MNNKNKKKLDWFIKGVLIIIIILLLLYNCRLNKKGNYDMVPTGNVDIIEIKCDKDDRCVKPDNNKGNENKGQKTITVNGDVDEEDEEVDSTGLIVQDNEITWNGQADAKIFSHSMYELGDVLAPESSNTYQFVVKNGTEYNLKYNLNFIEDNPYMINMKYKLKKNDTYLIDQYVIASEINLSDSFLNIGSNDTFYLEWKWISSDNDTQIGKTSGAYYGLKIEVKAESTNG